MNTHNRARCIATVLLSLLLGGCLSTEDPVFTSQDSKAIPSLQGTWYDPLNRPLTVSLLSSGEYLGRAGAAGEPEKMLLIPIQNGFYIVQIFAAENKRYSYALVRIWNDRVELREVDANHEGLDRRAARHGILAGASDSGEDLTAYRRLSKNDVIGFFKDVLALDALINKSTTPIDRLVYTRMPQQDPSERANKRAAETQSPATPPTAPATAPPKRGKPRIGENVDPRTR